MNRQGIQNQWSILGQNITDSVVLFITYWDDVYVRVELPYHIAQVRFQHVPCDLETLDAAFSMWPVSPFAAIKTVYWVGCKKHA